MSLPVSLKSSNSFSIDSHCPAIYYIRHENDLLPFYGRKPEDYYILGGGTNILLMSEISRPVIKVEIKGREVIHDEGDQIVIRVGGGENWHAIVEWTLQQGFYGLENLSLIPGTVGAAPVQNIGAYGVELKDVFHELEAVDLHGGNVKVFSHEECRFGYRDSIFKQEAKNKYVITSVTFRLDKIHKLNTTYGAIEEELKSMGISKPTINDVSNAVINIRRSKLPDPAEFGNAGSFFKNPEIPLEDYNVLKKAYPDLVAYKTGENKMKLAAGWLIEQCGWKGKIVGNVGMHRKQALVLVNYGNAGGEELISHARKVQKSIEDKFGVLLEMEVNII